MYLYCLNQLVLLMILGALTFVEVVDGTLVHDHGTCYTTKEAELACSEMFISEAKWRVMAFQFLPWSPSAKGKRKRSLSETTPTEKPAYTFRTFAEAPSTMCLSREARRRWASMVVYNIVLQIAVMTHSNGMAEYHKF